MEFLRTDPILMAKSDPPVVKTLGQHNAPAHAASLHPLLPRTLAATPPPALMSKHKLQRLCPKTRHGAQREHVDRAPRAARCGAALTPQYPVMLRAGSTESKRDVAKASGPVQNSLIQAYIVCVSDSLFSQHLGTLTLICV